jgi:hypothetical protein
MRGKVTLVGLPYKGGEVDVKKVHAEGSVVAEITDKYGKEYFLFLFDWHSAFHPYPWEGAEVEFDVVADKYARRVFSQDDVTDIMQRYPGPVTLRSPWKKNIWPAIFMPLLGIGGIVLLFTQNVYMILLGIVFALGGFFSALVYAVSLIPGASTLVLDHQGFEVTFLFRKRAYAWDAAMLPDHPGHDKKNTFQRRLRDPHSYGVVLLPLLMQQWCRRALGLINTGISYWPELIPDKEFLESFEENNAATGAKPVAPV